MYDFSGQTFKGFDSVVANGRYVIAVLLEG
jgi:hypothetical protein